MYTDFEISFQTQITAKDSNKKDAMAALHFGGSARFGDKDVAPSFVSGGSRCQFGDRRWGMLGGFGMTPEAAPEAPEAVMRAIKPDAFNAVTIRREGAVVTTAVNGVPAAKAETRANHRGIITWSLYGNVVEIRIRDIQFTDLCKTSP